MKAVVAAFNQEKALVGAFSVITNLRMELFEALVVTMTRRRYVAVCGATTRILHQYLVQNTENTATLKLNISFNYQCRLQLKIGAAKMLETSEVESVQVYSGRRRHLS